MRRPSTKKKIRGFSTAEVSMSALIVGILMAAALNCSGAALRGQLATADQARAAHFASTLMAEIMEQSFENPDGTPTFGRESGELATSRANYDDVDDYHNWSSVPTQKDGTVLANGTGYTTTVQVTYGNPNDLADGKASGPSSVKRVTVTVFQGSQTAARLKGVVCK